MSVDFVGIGAQKAGTTWVFDVLREHPDAAGPRYGAADRKELNFFNLHYPKGHEWYHAQFPDTQALAGEFSPLYMASARAAERIHAYDPDVKLIVCLRDPVERAYSHHKMHVANRLYDGNRLARFEAALDQNPAYLELGRYARQLGPFLERFPREQLHVVLMDDVRSRPAEVARDLYAFLDLDPDATPTGLGEARNPSRASASPLVDRAKDGVARGLRALGGPGLLQRARESRALKWVNRFLEAEPGERTVPPMGDETRARLARAFREDVAFVEDLLDRELPDWATGPEGGNPNRPEDST